jgi:ACS family glucarate transporter-like MFS transporter
MFLSMTVGAPLVAWLVVHLGWRWTFVATGFPGFLWAFLWLKWFRQPEECSWLSSEERELILETRQDGAVRAEAGGVSIGASLKALLSQRSVWGLCLTQGSQNYMQLLFLAWLPSYLVHRGMTLMKAGVYTAIPFLIGAVMEIVICRISDRILKPEDQRRGKRRNQLAVYLLCTSAILFVPLLNNELAIMAVITIPLGFSTTVGALNGALASDLIQDHKIAGSAFGLLILGGNLIGLVGPIATGYIVRATGSFNSAFVLAGGVALVGAVCVFTMTRRPIHGSTGLVPSSVAVTKG